MLSVRNSILASQHKYYKFKNSLLEFIQYCKSQTDTNDQVLRYCTYTVLD